MASAVTSIKPTDYAVAVFDWGKKREKEKGKSTTKLVQDIVQRFPTVRSIYDGNVCVAERRAILCVEIGLTRVKAAILPREVNAETLKRMQVVTFPSKEWRCEKIGELFCRRENNPLQAFIGRQSYASISLSISGPVTHNRFYMNSERRIPQDLKATCEAEAGCPVIVENDAVSFARGVVAYNELMQRTIQYPCLVLTLGTFVGAAIIHKASIEALEIDDVLKAVAKAPSEKDDLVMKLPHFALGRDYFTHRFKGHEYSDDQMKPYLEEYNSHFQYAVRRVCEYLQTAHSVKISSIVVGGGNSRFIHEKHTNTTALSPKKLGADGIDQDMVQLLGCHRLICKWNSL